MIEKELQKIYNNCFKIKNNNISSVKFFTFDGVKYNGNWFIHIDRKNKEYDLLRMKKITEMKNFYAFFESEKGEKLIKENKHKIIKKKTIIEYNFIFN